MRKINERISDDGDMIHMINSYTRREQTGLFWKRGGNISFSPSPLSVFLKNIRELCSEYLHKFNVLEGQKVCGEKA